VFRGDSFGPATDMPSGVADARGSARAQPSSRGGM
jgi:hypothetical protein